MTEKDLEKQTEPATVIVDAAERSSSDNAAERHASSCADDIPDHKGTKLGTVAPPPAIAIDDMQPKTNISNDGSPTSTSKEDKTSPVPTAVATGGEQPPVDAEAIYAKYSRRRKAMFVTILSFCAISSPVSSTASLTAVPQIADTFGTTGSIVNVSNSLYTVMMGLSAFLWGSLSTLAGRRIVLFTSIISFFLFSLGTALSPNLAALFVFRTLSGFGGTGLLVAGPGCIGDLYKPTERATALGWFMTGALVGPAIGLVLGGAIVTYGGWRDIFWFQSAMSGLGAVLAVVFIPETIHRRKWPLIPKGQRIRETARALNPLKLLKLYTNANLVLVTVASSSLLFNMYSFLAPIVYVINPRLGLTTSLQAGLFYIPPGAGYLAGTFFGGRWADYTVKKWIGKRGFRKSEDRLRSAIPFMGLGMPATMLIYGWCLEKDKGGIPLIVIVMFLQGFCQLMIFPSLNTFLLDVIPSRSAEVVAANYLIRYSFGAAGAAVVLPAVNALGIGWFCTISTIFVVVACGGLLLVVRDLVPGQGKSKTTPSSQD